MGYNRKKVYKTRVYDQKAKTSRAHTLSKHIYITYRRKYKQGNRLLYVSSDSDYLELSSEKLIGMNIIKKVFEFYFFFYTLLTKNLLYHFFTCQSKSISCGSQKKHSIMYNLTIKRLKK